jgi:uncharacterized paraquat-inducible protein A
VFIKGLKMLPDQILSELEINDALKNTDLVVCPHCQLVSNIGGLVGESTNDCPKCGYTILQSIGV